MGPEPEPAVLTQLFATRQVGFPALEGTDFACACSTLGDHGLLGLGAAREERLRRVTLRAAPDDVALALRELRLFSQVLGRAPAPAPAPAAVPGA